MTVAVDTSVAAKWFIAKWFIKEAGREQAPLDAPERLGARLITADPRLLAATDNTEFASLAVHVAAF